MADHLPSDVRPAFDPAEAARLRDAGRTLAWLDYLSRREPGSGFATAHARIRERINRAIREGVKNAR